MRRKQQRFAIAAAYDTETTNLGDDENARAFPVLFIDNDLRDRDLREYDPKDDTIRLYRTEEEMEARIAEYALWGRVVGRVPIICAYNLMFDLQPMMQYLSENYDLSVNAQTSTNVYTIDLYEQDTNTLLLRFWDTYHLEMRGLAAMGETAGLPKAMGDWDYSLVRTPKTPLTDDERFYAGRDTQVIPMYLRYLLRANEWMKQDDLGVRVLTKTSVVRQMARREIGSIYVGKRDGKKLSLDKAFIEHCKAEFPPTFAQYALRKACFRGGFTFTAARYAGEIQHDVISLDVTSMHHTFINGRMVPEGFQVVSNAAIQLICDQINRVTTQDVLSHYEQPFKNAFHARIRFTNIRLKKDSVFNRTGIALESTSKFKREMEPGIDIGADPRAVAQENLVRSLGWHDCLKGGICAFGKMYAAEEAILDLSEIEYWCVKEVYEWDSMEVLFGEATSKFRMPPDFVSLQSNELFEMKSKAKFISKHYEQGRPYPFNLDGIPDGIADELRKGTCDPRFFESWYTGTVKGMFNGIYGTMAQDVLKPSYKCVGGELVVDDDTRTTPENYEEKIAKIGSLRVLYTYGLRIVGGSRMHMVISMELLDDAFGNDVRILGGDTDSMKVALGNRTEEEIEEALKPIADASKKAIDAAQRRLRTNWPEKASSLKGIGAFDIENSGHHYESHIELWNKCRVSWDGEHSHVTCAGLRRPAGTITIETVIDKIAEKYGIETALTNVIGYDVCVMPSVSHSLMGHKPAAKDTIDMNVTDWRGTTRHVTSHQSTALYPAARWLGETSKFTNLSSVLYLKRNYGRDMTRPARYVGCDEDGRVWVKEETEDGIVTILEG